jgi:hypothetical protein
MPPTRTKASVDLHQYAQCFPMLITWTSLERAAASLNRRRLTCR